MSAKHFEDSMDTQQQENIIHRVQRPTNSIRVANQQTVLREVLAPFSRHSNSPFPQIKRAAEMSLDLSKSKCPRKSLRSAEDRNAVMLQHLRQTVDISFTSTQRRYQLPISNDTLELMNATINGFDDFDNTATPEDVKKLEVELSAKLTDYKDLSSRNMACVWLLWNHLHCLSTNCDQLADDHPRKHVCTEGLWVKVNRLIRLFSPFLPVSYEIMKFRERAEFKIKLSHLFGNPEAINPHPSTYYRYYLAKSEADMLEDQSKFSLRPCISNIPSTGFGLMTEHLIPKGTIVGAYFGSVRQENTDEWETEGLADSEYIEEDKTPIRINGSIAKRNEFCAFYFLNCIRDKKIANLTSRSVNKLTKQVRAAAYSSNGRGLKDHGDSLPRKVMFLSTTRDVQPGEELYWNYGKSGEEDSTRTKFVIIDKAMAGRRHVVSNELPEITKVIDSMRKQTERHFRSEMAPDQTSSSQIRTRRALQSQQLASQQSTTDLTTTQVLAFLSTQTTNNSAER
ncbi:hypothetical protein M3Y95_00916400 [Aphelenchoides besseyi]|nr:hypothetical protein M3Y95_00916400 [Aphelenchoides besseyi]